MENFGKSLIILVLAASLASCAREAFQPVTQEDTPVSIDDSKLVAKGIVDIQVTEELAAKLENGDASDVLRAFGATSIERVFPDAGEFEAKHRKAGLHLWYAVNFDPEVKTTKAVGDLGDVEGIEKVETLRKIKPTVSWAPIPFNDTYAGYQWSLINNGKMYTGFKSGADINVKDVWSNYTTGSSNVIVAVIDEGVDLSHPDLSKVTLAAKAGGSANFCSKASNRYKVDSGDHGTFCAGVIGAINGNGKGVCGIAGGTGGNGGVKIMSIEIMNDNDECTSNGLYQAFVYAADNGAVIANNSWGYDFDEDGDGEMSSSEYAELKAFVTPSIELKAMDYFVANAGTDANGNQTGPMRGGLVVFAAGNEDCDLAKPANYENVVAVGAIGPDLKRAYYSNYGDWVDICAPGGSDRFGDYGWITSCVAQSSEGDYAGMIGTSMAAPHVSGVAALLVSYFGGTGYTVDKLKEQLLKGANTTVESGFDHKIGPLVDAYGAFTAGGNLPPQVIDDIDDFMFGGVGETYEIDLTKVFIDPDKDALKYTVKIDGDVVSSSVSGDKLTFTCLNFGSASVKVTASDKEDETAETKFDIITRDMNYAFDLYPNPVEKILNVRRGSYDSKVFYLRLFSPAGKQIAQFRMAGNVFDPSTVDMSKCASGTYTVELECDGTVEQMMIVKK